MSGSATDALRAAGVARGGLVGLAVAEGVGAALALDGARSLVVPDAEAAVTLAAVDHELRPRWVVWSQQTAAALIAGDVRLATAWDLAAVHRLLEGGWRADPARVWATARGLDLGGLPRGGPLELFDLAEHDADPEVPVRADGYLRPDWAEGGWVGSPTRLTRWAALALEVARWQQGALAALVDRPAAPATARAESTAELLCAELAADGLPMDRLVLEALVASIIGPRPRDAAEVEERRAARDAEVLRHAPGPWDLRSPGQVRSLLRSVGIEVPDTRAWRLRGLRGTHPAVDAVLEWRRAERVATTYGYAWIDEHLGADGRLRGQWSSSDGAAGRMTASAGLHNMPAEMRAAVVAEAGHRFVRADLGQIEPRVLAAVSGDPALAHAATEDDMYAPVAHQLGVDRETAKVAVLGAMYGQTTGHGAAALRRLAAAYPVAIAYLEEADRAAQGRRTLRTHGGRCLPMGHAADHEAFAAEARGQTAARGRYGRNAMVQGAAAELFKVWAVTVRARGAALGARVVLCLHDELLVHAPEAVADDVARLVDDALAEAALRWAPPVSRGNQVRFVADTRVLRTWADAKG